MKIGILTFHSQTNYGGVLQCWALRQALISLGHDVVVIDRWMHPTRKNLDGPFGHAGIIDWIRILLQAFFGCRNFQHIKRQLKTKRFVDSIGLTPYHFYDWKDAPKDLGVDCIVVGSDQIWHGGDWGYPDPNPYLLIGAPKIKAIAYAASFGMKTLPPEYDYRFGFSKFCAISVREADGVDLVKSAGYNNPVAHVVDPSLLISKDVWNALVRKSNHNKVRCKKLVCYFLAVDSDYVRFKINQWAEKNDYKVEILIRSCVRPFPKSIRQCLSRIKQIYIDMFCCRAVNCACDYGPKEFVDAFAHADACVTDSFHAIMFSSIFNVNCRFIMPEQESRKRMFARVQEFARTTVNGNMIVNSLDEALFSIANEENIGFKNDIIEERRNFSLKWLSSSLQGE